ncbi:Mobile element protein [hydrothermal vent metagenome]|uniref:Mobile element protein n=1 Tax=hydrothermal vent metagenome TaxID=652676 RepID=A0A1W1DZP1_9ZZZZ
MEHHLGYAKHEQNAHDIGISNNARNGYYPKTIKGSHGEVEISVPRDRGGSFDPIIVEKWQTRLGSFDSQMFNLHLKECEFRFNNRKQNLYKVLLEMFRKESLKLS